MIEIRTYTRSFWRLVCVAVIAALLSCAFALCSTTPAWAVETQTLSGIIDGATVDSSYSTVVLDGVTVKNGADITIEGNDVTLVVKDGTSNSTGLIQSNNSLTVTGSGDLHASSLFAGAGMTLNYNGTLAIDDGVIFTSTGDLIINSGTYKVTAKDSQQYALGSLAGGIYVNGGTLTLRASTHAIHSALGAIVLAGGTLDATSDSVAIVAGDRLSNGVIIGPSMQLANGLTTADISTDGGSIVSCVVGADGKVAFNVQGEGPAVTQGSVTADGATHLSADEAKSASAANSKTGITAGRIVLIAIIGVGVLVAVIAGVIAVRNSSKKKNGRS